jgi:hypothetical protein
MTLTAAPLTPSRRFPMPIAARWIPVLLLFGVRRATAYVDIGDGRLVARFGRLRVETPLDNITGFQITGPYRWWRAIGVRRTVGRGDQDVSFGTTARGGVCLGFREPVKLPVVPATSNLTVTVRDIDGFVATLRELGIEGTDERTSRA